MTHKISKILQILNYKIWVSTQKSWILDGFVSFFIINLIDVAIAFTIAIIYSTSLKYKIEIIYKISLFLNDIGHWVLILL